MLESQVTLKQCFSGYFNHHANMGCEKTFWASETGSQWRHPQPGLLGNTVTVLTLHLQSHQVLTKHHPSYPLGLSFPHSSSAADWLHHRRHLEHLQESTAKNIAHINVVIKDKIWVKQVKMCFFGLFNSLYLYYYLFLYCAQNFPSLLFYLQTWHYQIADPSSMQDACHMNFVINLTHCRVSVAQWKSNRARNPKV